MLHVRSMAAGAAVICFFALGIVGSIAGLSPFVSCKRALLGAVVAYITAGTAVRAVNAVVTQAMITSHINKNKEWAGDVGH